MTLIQLIRLLAPWTRSIAPLFILLFTSVTTNWIGTATQAQAEPMVSIQTKQARGQVAGRRRGGARRGDCPATSTELTAIVPETKVMTQNLPEIYVGGITAAERPTFWFYVPYALHSELTAEFILQDEMGQEIYRITSADFTADPTPGIVRITLPATIAPLEIGQVYQWYFKLNCQEVALYVQGGIERVVLNTELATQLANASPQTQAELYQSNDLWLDAITALGNAYRTNPTDAATRADWSNLLQTIDLDDIPY